jgi:hypothetical protein
MVRLPAPVRNAIESVRSRIVAPVQEELSIERNNAELLRESVTDLERQLHDPGWQQFVAYAQQEFSPEGMVQLRAICRLYTLKNPILKRAASLRSAYVHGQGVEITARANGKEHEGEQDVQAVVSAFLDDPGNKRTLTGAEARNQNEHALFTDGELFHALFTSPRTGRVQVRTLPCDEIIEVICNPEDNSEPWFYRRRWVQMSYQGNGTQRHDLREELYPCLDYKPPGRFQTYANMPVRWDAPVVHTTVNRPLHWHRGVPDAYAGVDWARAYKTFLEDWATLMKSLAKFAWRLTSKGSARAQARQALGAAAPRDPVTGKALDVGGTAVTPMDAIMEAIPKTGATLDSESGRPLAAMAGAAYDMPVTMLLADPGTTGNRATAETLDRPTELVLGQRRDLWTSTLQRILSHVITAAVRAPQGPLRGTIIRDPYSDQDVVTLDGDTSTKIDIEWPDLTGADIATIVKAIVDADSTGTMPPELVLRLVLTALGVRDVDELVEAMVDDDTGEFQWPSRPALGGTGGAAAGLLRAGRDPTDAGPGPMEDPEEPDPEEEPPPDEEDEEQDG